jgi:hypothetical protein
LTRTSSTIYKDDTKMMGQKEYTGKVWSIGGEME